MSQSNRFNAIVLTACLTAALGLSACGGGGGGGSSSSAGTIGGGPGTPVVPPAQTITLKMSTPEAASAMLARGTFGSTESAVSAAVDTDASDWLNAEFSTPTVFMLPTMSAAYEAGMDIDNNEPYAQFWDAAITGDDQLRRRMVFALSQITVVSGKSLNSRPLTMAHYIDVLNEHAFGNYRDLLQDLTYSPAMARYLTYLRNRKGDPNSGRVPDENYARELLQLFTIGLVELNMDGTPKLGVDSEPVEVFGNEDIVGLARVFTGLTEKGTGFWSSSADPDGGYSALVSDQDQHSPLEKTFLGLTITAGTPADDSITQALDHIFAHPNMAPFIARQLIQRFTASSPSPDYVARVANAFEAGQFTALDDTIYGTGERGDLKATLAAILLDSQFFDDEPASAEQGKVREPVLKFLHWARAFNVGNVDSYNEWRLIAGAESADRLGQAPFKSASVFNFYRPGFIAPGTQSGAAGLTVPEFQVVNESTFAGYTNFMLEFVFDTSAQRDDTLDTFKPDYSYELTLAETPDVLTDHLNGLLLGGRMSDTTRAAMIEAVGLLPAASVSGDEDDNLRRVQLAVYMAVTAPAFAVEY